MLSCRGMCWLRAWMGVACIIKLGMVLLLPSMCTKLGQLFKDSRLPNKLFQDPL